MKITYKVFFRFFSSGRKVRLRLVRDGVELPPIAADNNYDARYQSYRRLQNPVTVYGVSISIHFIYHCFSMTRRHHIVFDLLTYLLTYLLTHSLHGAGYFLKS
jgi:hypothetical protein